jgi:hypothetical protein
MYLNPENVHFHKWKKSAEHSSINQNEHSDSCNHQDKVIFILTKYCLGRCAFIIPEMNYIATTQQN